MAILEVLERRPTNPYLLGVTGNIACGKSTVLRRLAELGALTVDADRVVHQLMVPDAPVWQAIRAEFGPDVIAPDRQINRAVLGAIVFSDPAQLARLEDLTHPAVRREIVQRVYAAGERGVEVLVIDAIKLYEGGLAEYCDETWAVTCDPVQQLVRLMARNNFDEAEARKRITAQPPQAEKVARATLVIDNSGDEAVTYALVDAAWAQLQRRRRKS